MKKNIKRKIKNVEPEANEEPVPAVRRSDEPLPKKVKWINKQRVLVLSLRGISHRYRHLMVDVKTLLPHSKSDNKVEKDEYLTVMNEIAEMKNCNKCILFENRRHTDLYVWMANIEGGPSCKFLVENVYTMRELKLTGNCLIGSRPLLSFDESFSKETHYQLIKEMLIQIFSTPNHHPKSQPFIDRVTTFTILDNKIWFRNYQILSEDGALAEIGPRFVLTPIKIFAGSFCGEVLWKNQYYMSPAKYRQSFNKRRGDKYLDKKLQRIHYRKTKPEVSYKLKPLDDMFKDDSIENTQDMIGSSNHKSIKKNKHEKNKKIKQKNKSQMVEGE